MDVYIISLSGGGDTEVKVIDQEAWDWLHSDPPKFDNGSGCDSVPGSQFNLIKSEGYIDEEEQKEEGCPNGILVTIGSWENDRALMARTIERYQIITFEDNSSALEEIKKKGDSLVDIYSGYIY